MDVRRPGYRNLNQYFKRNRAISQRTFAKRVSVSPSYICKILKGEKVPSLAKARDIATEANIPIESLLGVEQ